MEVKMHCINIKSFRLLDHGVHGTNAIKIEGTYDKIHINVEVQNAISCTI